MGVGVGLGLGWGCGSGLGVGDGVGVGLNLGIGLRCLGCGPGLVWVGWDIFPFEVGIPTAQPPAAGWLAG